MTNCPNCGAVITGRVCEYCGTVFNVRRSAIGYPVYDYKTGRHITDLLDRGLITPNEARQAFMLETEQIKNQHDMQKLYADALAAMREYRTECVDNEKPEPMEDYNSNKWKWKRFMWGMSG